MAEPHPPQKTTFPTITVWRANTNTMRRPLIAYTSKTKLIANEIQKDLDQTIYEFQSKDPRIWVPIKDPFHKLQDKGIYCLNHNLPKTITIKAPTFLTINLVKKFSNGCTGKDFYDELGIVNPNIRVFSRCVPNSYGEFVFPSYRITNETNLPLYGLEEYVFDLPPVKPSNPAPTKRKCPEIE